MALSTDQQARLRQVRRQHGPLMRRAGMQFRICQSPSLKVNGDGFRMLLCDSFEKIVDARVMGFRLSYC